MCKIYFERRNSSKNCEKQKDSLKFRKSIEFFHGINHKKFTNNFTKKYKKYIHKHKSK